MTPSFGLYIQKLILIQLVTNVNLENKKISSSSEGALVRNNSFKRNRSLEIYMRY
jgi:hypothetical protein